MVDLWISQPFKFMETALDEGFRKFTWHSAELFKSNNEVLSWFRAHTAGYGPAEMMLINFTGAILYDNYSNYTSPKAVYPTWASDEKREDLIWLMENNVAEMPDFYASTKVQSEFRPVKGQEHSVVVHRIPPAGDERQLFMLQMREIQKAYPKVKLMISGAKKFADIFGFGFGAVDYFPDEYTHSGISCNRVVLPTGKILPDDRAFDMRYTDWFDLVGMDQADMFLQQERVRMCLRSARWASLFWDNVTPFVAPAKGRGGKTTVFVPTEYNKVRDTDFVLPAARRRLMRNVGINAGELDKFRCDTCILMNACTLYREGAVCAVKGSETVGLADAFGTRNVDAIIGALGQITVRNAQRLEDAMAAEDPNELDPEVTKLSKTVFDQGTKLAKLIDPNLNGGAKVQVNVGVGAGGNAQVAVGSADPKQLMATIVADLEMAGIPREAIDSTMIKGVLRNMAQTDQRQAISTAATSYKGKQQERQAIASIPGQIVEGDNA